MSTPPSSWRSRLYAFAFVTTHKTVAGLDYGRWLRITLFILIIIALILLQWELAFVLLLVRLAVGLIYRRAKKNGYTTFFPDQTPFPADLPPLKTDERVGVRVTGKVSAGEAEFDVLLRKTNIWCTGLNEYVLMVERSGQSYLYQFIQPAHIDGVEVGRLQFGTSSYFGLRVIYHTDWSPQLINHRLAYYVGGGNSDNRLKLTLYVTAEAEGEDDTAIYRLAQSLKDRDKG